MTPGSSLPGTAGHDALDAIRSGGLVPLYSSPDVDDLYRVAEALVSAGIFVMEVTLRAPGTLEALGPLVQRVASGGLPLMVGAGTVLDAAAAEAAIRAGARFIFSPIVDPAVAARCRADEIAWIPGCATPTEVHTAMTLGCVAVKLFPADAIGGPGFLRSIRSVFPGVRAIPSGGIGPAPDVIEAWFRAGAIAVAMGSELFPGRTATGDDPTELQRRLASAVSAVAAARERLTT